MIEHPIKDAVIAASVSAGSAGTSLFVATLPLVQWLAGVVAILSGLVAIALGLVRLHQWLKRRDS